MTLRADQMTRRFFIMLAGTVAGAGGIASFAEAAPITEADRKNIEAVRGMSAAWKSGDAEKIASFLSDTCTFRGQANDPGRPAIIGATKFAEQMGQALKSQTIDMQIRDMFALDPLVVTSHYQLFESKTQGPREDLFIGVFFMKDGKIQEWNDYGIILPRVRAAKLPASIGRFHHVG
jgi:ketosteroid isomerase-like protein